MRLKILASSSAGNCALLAAGETRILVDAGLSLRRTRELLAAAGASWDAIDAIFLTHEHGDHAGGLASLTRHRHLTIYASHGTARVLAGPREGPGRAERLREQVQWRVFAPGDRFRHGDLEVETFPVPHDAAEPVAYVFRSGAGDPRSPRCAAAWLTDLGHVTELARQRVADADVLVLEANHDEVLLRNDPHRPWSLKQRITGRHGHLSNTAAADLVASLPARRRHVLLSHLSSDCNSVACVTAAFARCAAGLAALHIIPPGEGSPLLDLAAA